MTKTLAALGFAAALAGLAAPAPAQEAARPRPQVDVVFVLDTTGSMSGMIEGAKQKIWAIANEIAKGKPTPRIRMGLVAYRDRGDEYVTKVTDLSDNLDTMYKELLALSAGGGGDGPEHVLKGLEDAIERVSWSSDPKALRLIYLVGDAPPHQDYGDTPPLAALLQKAVRKGLMIHALQCGSDAATSETWRLVARLGEGRYLSLPQDGGAVAVATPFDGKLAVLSRRLESTLVAYGGRKAEARNAMELSAAIAGAAAAPAAADRAVFKSRSGFGAEMDLAQAVEEGRVKVASLKDEDLPEGWKELSHEQRSARLSKVIAERARLKNEIASLSADRADYISREKAKSPAKKDGFDAKLVDSLKEAARRKGIAY